jgi:hypothetical protein
MLPLNGPPRGRMERKLALARRALEDLESWRTRRFNRSSSVRMADVEMKSVS